MKIILFVLLNITFLLGGMLSVKEEYYDNGQLKSRISYKTSKFGKLKVVETLYYDNGDSRLEVLYGDLVENYSEQYNDNEAYIKESKEENRQELFEDYKEYPEDFTSFEEYVKYYGEEYNSLVAYEFQEIQYRAVYLQIKKISQSEKELGQKYYEEAIKIEHLTQTNENIRLKVKKYRQACTLNHAESCIRFAEAFVEISMQSWPAALSIPGIFEEYYGKGTGRGTKRDGLLSTENPYSFTYELVYLHKYALYKKACNLGNAQGCHILAWTYKEIANHKFIKYMHKACEIGHCESCYRLAAVYDPNSNYEYKDIAPNGSKAKKIYQKAYNTSSCRSSIINHLSKNIDRLTKMGY